MNASIQAAGFVQLVVPDLLEMQRKRLVAPAWM
jgi:hypothetical protein